MTIFIGFGFSMVGFVGRGILSTNGNIAGETRRRWIWAGGTDVWSRLGMTGAGGFIGIVCLMLLGCQPHGEPKHADGPSLPIPNDHGLVTVEWLKSALDQRQSADEYSQAIRNPGQPNDAENSHEATRKTQSIVIVEASWADLANAKDYHRGHIPGAIHVNTDLFENGYPQWKLKPIESLQQTIGDFGISPDTVVIVYSEQLIAATRVWWILMYAGVEDVRILDGDARTWKEAGFELEQATRELPPVSFVATPRTHWIMDTETLRAQIVASQEMRSHNPLVPLRLFDMRSRPEYDGTISGYTYLDAKGRIPGAIWLGDADDSSQTYKLASGRLRPPREVYAEWQVQGLELSQRSDSAAESLQVFYCGGGWRSSAAFYYAWLGGAQNIRNYSEGWAGWSTRYVRDDSAQGNTPGWLQQKTDNPVEPAEPASRR